MITPLPQEFGGLSQWMVPGTLALLVWCVRYYLKNIRDDIREIREDQKYRYVTKTECQAHVKGVNKRIDDLRKE